MRIIISDNALAFPLANMGHDHSLYSHKQERNIDDSYIPFL